MRQSDGRDAAVVEPDKRVLLTPLRFFGSLDHLLRVGQCAGQRFFA